MQDINCISIGPIDHSLAGHCFIYQHLKIILKARRCPCRIVSAAQFMADEQVAQFSAVTGAPEDAAKFYLESSGGNLEAAINAFLEGGVIPEDAPDSEAAPAPTIASASPAQQSRSQPPVGFGALAKLSELFGLVICFIQNIVRPKDHFFDRCLWLKPGI